MMNRLFTIEETADLLRISKRGVWRLIADGELPKPLKVGRSSRFSTADVDCYLNSLIKKRSES